MIRHTLFFFLDLYFFYFHKNYLRLVGKHCDIDYARVVVKRYFSDFHLFLPPPVIQTVIKLSELIIKEIFHIRNKETSNKSVERSFTFFFFCEKHLRVYFAKSRPIVLRSKWHVSTHGGPLKMMFMSSEEIKIAKSFAISIQNSWRPLMAMVFWGEHTYVWKQFIKLASTSYYEIEKQWRINFETW